MVKGGFAIVYEVTSVSTGRKFAGKVVEKKGLTRTKLEKVLYYFHEITGSLRVRFGLTRR